ncbi:IS5 family transposase [Marinobacterium sp. MBR-111]
MKGVDADWHIAEQPGKLKSLKKHLRINKNRIRTKYLKASLRAKVEHPFRIIKCQFGFVKARCRGLKKNDGKLAMLFALSNLVCGPDVASTGLIRLSCPKWQLTDGIRHESHT